MKRLIAILRLKCPHCLAGPVFRRPFRMHEKCPNCGTRYEREDGYFMMSVFVGYVMAIVITLPVLAVLYLTIRPSLYGYVIWAAAALVVVSPLIFHFARIWWMHIDEMLDPRPDADDALNESGQ